MAWGLEQGSFLAMVVGDGCWRWLLAMVVGDGS